MVDCDIGSLIAQLQNYVFRRRVRIKEMRIVETMH